MNFILYLGLCFFAYWLHSVHALHECGSLTRLDAGQNLQHTNTISLGKQLTLHWKLSNNDTLLFTIETFEVKWFALGFSGDNTRCETIIGSAHGDPTLQKYLNLLDNQVTFYDTNIGEHVEFSKPVTEHDGAKLLYIGRETYVDLTRVNLFYDFGTSNDATFHDLQLNAPKLVRSVQQEGVASEEANRDLYLRTMQKAHGITMVVGWISCIYFAVILVRYLRGSFKRQWFRVYLLLQCLGLFVLFVGILFATLFDDTFPSSLFFQSHHLFGFLLIIFLVVQIMLGILADRKLSVMQNSLHQQTPVYPNKAHGYIGWAMMVMVIITNMLGAREMGVSSTTWALLSVVHGIPILYQVGLWVYTKKMRGIAVWGPGYVTMQTIQPKRSGTRQEQFEISEDITEDAPDADVITETPRSPYDILQIRIFVAVWVVTFGIVIALGVVM